MTVVDLRSDTVTRPSAAMREAIAAAPVGDDQYGEDPSVSRLEALVADLLGKERGLFVPTGTMANQLPLKLSCRPGDDVIVGRESHAVLHETGAGAANAGVQFTEIGDDGTFTADEFLAARNPQDHLLYPPTTLVEVEDTQNRMGGLVGMQNGRLWPPPGASTSARTPSPARRWKCGRRSRRPRSETSRCARTRR